MTKPDMRGKVCVVTGSSSGLGKATATGLAQFTANAIHAGLVKSGIMREAAAPIRWFTYLISTSPQKASETPVYYSSSPEVEGMTGLFFRGRQAIESNSYSKNLEVQKRLWDVSIALTGLG